MGHTAARRDETHLLSLNHPCCFSVGASCGQNRALGLILPHQAVLVVAWTVVSPPFPTLLLSSGSAALSGSPQPGPRAVTQQHLVKWTTHVVAILGCTHGRQCFLVPNEVQCDPSPGTLHPPFFIFISHYPSLRAEMRCDTSLRLLQPQSKPS